MLARECPCAEECNAGQQITQDVRVESSREWKSAPLSGQCTRLVGAVAGLCPRDMRAPQAAEMGSLGT